MIRVLPEEVRCRLRSGIAITSVGQCVEELLLNSADAQATCIAIRVDLEIFRVQVVDNGCGLGPEDMDRVGMRYFTSKCHSLNDLEDLRFYGFRGEAISSMADACSVVEITSKHKSNGQTFTKLFQNRKPLPVQQAEATRPSTGTTVTLYNLFYNLPVRRGCVDPVLEMERIRQKVEAASLMKPTISFSLKNDALHSMVLQLPKTQDACSRFCQIYGPVKSKHLREVHHNQDRLEIVGYISSEGHYNKTMQFLYVNSRLVLKTRLHKLIDLLLKKESVICRPKVGQAGRSSSSPGVHRTGSEVHGIFVLNIQCPYDEYDICFEPDKTLIEFQDWSSVLLCVEHGVKNFLKKENLYLEPSKDVPEPEDSSEPPTSRGTSGFVLVNCDPASLRSKSVCRRNVISAHMVDGSSVVDKTDTKAASAETISLSSHASQTDPSQGLDCPNLCSDFTPCRTDEVNPVADGKEDMKQLPGRQNRLGHHGATAGCSGLGSSKNDQELVNSSNALADHQHHSGQSTLCNKEAADQNKSKPPGVWDMHNFRGDLNCPSAITHRPCSLDSVHKAGQSAVMEKKLYKMISCCTDRLSAFAERERAVNTDHLSGITVYKATAVPTDLSKRTKLLKLHLPAGLGSLDKFKRSYGKKGTAASGHLFHLGAEPAKSEASCPSMDHIPPSVSEKMLHKEDEEKMAVSSSVIARTEALCPSMDHIPPSVSENRLHKEGEEKMAVPSSVIARTEALCPSMDHISPSVLENMLHKEGEEKMAVPSSVISRTEASCPSMDHIPPSVSEKRLRKEGEEKMAVPSSVIASPLTLSNYARLREKEPETVNTHSSLSTKLCRLKRDMDLASRPLEIRSGELQLKIDTDHLMAELSQNTEPSIDIQIHAHADMEKEGLVCEPEKDELEPQTPQIGIHLEEEGTPNSTEWLQHYEQNLGRNVFINLCTGLSTYSAPQADQTATCTKDLSTMSVRVVCDNGFQYQCHPFRTELLEPFLPRSSAERGPPSQRGDDSLQTMYSEWQNPVFPRHPAMAVDISKDGSDSLAVKIHNILYPYRFTKEMVLSMEVLQQVDNKFIACLVDTKTEGTLKKGGNLLVLVDQHAAHERVRLEQLIADSYEPSSEDRGKKLKVSTVIPPLELDLTEEQGRLLRVRAAALQKVGLSLSFPDSVSSRVLVGEVPQCFVEKKVSETQRRRATVARQMVEEFLLEELQQSPGAPLGSLPGTVLKVLASQACHGAVKFNDPLSVDECRHLVRCLAKCSLPFQCAHGRPAILPLADLLHLQPEDQVSPKPNLNRLRRHYKAWRLFGSSCSMDQPAKAETHPDTQHSQAEVKP